MKAVLTVEENGVRRRFVLAGETLVGRDPACRVRLVTPTVSRRHAAIVRSEEGWRLKDLASGNGTFVDDKRTDESLLVSRETIRFGTVSALFEELEESVEPTPVSQKIPISLSRTLTIRPSRTTRTRAAVVAIALTVGLMLLATILVR